LRTAIEEASKQFGIVNCSNELPFTEVVRINEVLEEKITGEKYVIEPSALDVELARIAELKEEITKELTEIEALRVWDLTKTNVLEHQINLILKLNHLDKNEDQYHHNSKKLLRS
jgi:hypothetical protein